MSSPVVGLRHVSWISRLQTVNWSKWHHPCPWQHCCENRPKKLTRERRSLDSRSVYINTHRPLHILNPLVFGVLLILEMQLWQLTSALHPATKKAWHLDVLLEVQWVVAMETLHNAIQLHWCTVAGFQNIADRSVASSCTLSLILSWIFASTRSLACLYR